VAAKSEFYDLIIVGGGPGGLTAGLYAKRAALNAVLIEKGVPGGQVAITKGVENYPGFEDITGLDLSEKLLRHAQSYGLEVLQQEVTAVEPGSQNHVVRLANGDSLGAHAVILATGGNARKLGVPGETEYFGKGVSYCATCDGFFFRDKTVVVVGGGDSAVEEALYLSKLVRKIYIVHRRDSFRASRILQERAMKDPKIEIIWNTTITEIKADEAGVDAVTLQNIQTGAQRDIETEGVFIFVGFSPNNLLVPSGVTVNERGYVITDDKCETNIPGIFVVGDLRRKYANQIVIAMADGCTVALAAARYVETKGDHH
jgi:thioredoxin reductase (NADPH)